MRRRNLAASVACVATRPPVLTTSFASQYGLIGHRHNATSTFDGDDSLSITRRADFHREIHPCTKANLIQGGISLIGIHTLHFLHQPWRLFEWVRRFSSNTPRAKSGVSHCAAVKVRLFQPLCPLIGQDCQAANRRDDGVGCNAVEVGKRAAAGARREVAAFLHIAIGGQCVDKLLASG